MKGAHESLYIYYEQNKKEWLGEKEKIELLYVPYFCTASCCIGFILTVAMITNFNNDLSDN